ncbi:hypothetical protein [Tsukamurella sp. NPDC003166]|uniref:hypothetical protein n=1 Tax=Tsukamurella sp. NPDC003166 TaxID=3154444 RepID=UPI0033BD8009
MSVDSRIEEFALAPSDPAWGDERNRDEFYRASALASFWSVYVFFGVAMVAAAQGAILTALIALVAPGVIQIVVVRSYCRRHGVALSRLTEMFNRGRRRWVSLLTTLPMIAVTFLLLALHLGGAADRTSTLLGALAGGAVGAALAALGARLLLRRERRDEQLASLEDDVFD